MPLHLYPNVYASGSVPKDWSPIKGFVIRYPVRNSAVLQYLRQLQAGKWQKVIKKGSSGETHYIRQSRTKDPQKNRLQARNACHNV